MNKKYCKCGHVNEYSYALPKFCGGCTQPLSTEAQASSRPKNRMPVRYIYTEEEEHQESHGFKDSMRGLAVEIDIDDNVHKLENLMKEEKIGIARPTPSSSKGNKQDIFKALHEETNKLNKDAD